MSPPGRIQVVPSHREQHYPTAPWNVATIISFAIIAVMLFSDQYLTGEALQSLDAGMTRMGLIFWLSLKSILPVRRRLYSWVSQAVSFSRIPAMNRSPGFREHCQNQSPDF